MTLANIDAAKHRMTTHLLSGEFGQTECGLDASTVHATGFIRNIDCPMCAKVFLYGACFDPDPQHCGAEAHARAALLAYPRLEEVR